MIVVFRRDGETNMLAAGQVLEGLHDVLDEKDEVGLPEMQLHLSCIDLSQVHYLVDQAVDAQAVAIHQVVGVLAGGVRLVLAQGAQRPHHEGERRPDLVGKVGEQAEPEFLEFCVLGLPPPLLLLFPEPGQQARQEGEQDEIKDVRAALAVPGRLHAQVDGPGGVFLGRAFEKGADLQLVAAGGYVGVGGRTQAGRGCLPVGIVSPQAVIVDDALGIGVFRDGELDGEQVHIIRDQDLRCLW